MAPGYIKTEMVTAVPAKVLEAIIAEIPIRRLGKPEEIARCVVFLSAGSSICMAASTTIEFLTKPLHEQQLLDAVHAGIERAPLPANKA